MAKTTYASMKMKVQTNPKEIDFNGNKIEVLQYLPIEDKYDLVMVTLQKSLEDGVYNPIKKDMYFHLYLVYMYTDITFTDKQKEDESKLYDVLESNGLITEVIKNIPEDGYVEWNGAILKQSTLLFHYSVCFFNKGSFLGF